MSGETLTDGTVTLVADPSSTEGAWRFTAERAGKEIGVVALRSWSEDIALLSWEVAPEHLARSSGERAVRLAADWALGARADGGLGVSRVEARVAVGERLAVKAGVRAGLRKEGVSRALGTEGHVLLGRLAGDPPVTEPLGFRSMLNSVLPRKRAIGQMLIRDHQDRVLLCSLTYKRDWDLPGGVVEVGESPRIAVSREVEEELALTIPAGPLVLTDWLPPWGGWDDAVCLVFDGGVHDGSIVDRVVREEREIQEARFLDPEQVRDRCADFTARRVEAALAAVRGEGPGYTESGRAVPD